MRNQNIYTARVTDGLFVSAPGNSKQFNGFQRAFVVVAENASAVPRTYRLRIENQPVGGQASFLQFGAPLTTLDVTTPALSSVARTVFVTAQDENARIRVSVTEVTAPGGTVVADGLTGSVVLNPDPQQPGRCRIRRCRTRSLQNPVSNIAQGEAYNPGITSGAGRRAEPAESASAESEPAEPEPAEPVDSESAPAESERCRIRRCRIRSLQNDAVANPSIVNAGSAESEPAEPDAAEPEPAEPSLQNPESDRTPGSATPTGWSPTRATRPRRTRSTCC